VTQFTSELDVEKVRQEYGEKCLYFNTGCSGRKPQSVLEAIKPGVAETNQNPCQYIFMNSQPMDAVREALSEYLQVPTRSIFLAFSGTHALQTIMQSFLLKAGDELVTAEDEHGSLRTIAEYLTETRGIIVKKHTTDPFRGSAYHCESLLNLVTNRTSLVAVSEIGCYTGWRPDLSQLVQNLDRQSVPLLIDGAQTPGQGRCLPGRYPLWIGSGHKWLGGPSGTAFGYVRSDYIPKIMPVVVGDKTLVRRTADLYDLTRLESWGTSDTSKWLGLLSTVKLQMELGPERIARYQLALAKNFRSKVSLLNPKFRLPAFDDLPRDEWSSMVGFNFPIERLKTQDLQQYLFKNHRMAVQLDFLNPNPAHGMRVSVHVSNAEAELDQLINAIRMVVN
jgi:cysteine desulfurase / selenocysteine lyase